MKQQIKKLCKQLGRFDFNDFAGILELPDDEVQTLLDELTSDKVIRQISGTEYAYIPVVPLSAQKEVPQMPPLTVKNRVLSPEELKPFNNEDQQKIFDEAPEYNQRHIIKCLNIFKLTNGLRGNELIKMLRYITQKYPEYKMGYNSYLRWKSEYARFGIKGLLKKPRSESNKFTISEDLLSEYEEIFLSPKMTENNIWEMLVLEKYETGLPLLVLLADSLMQYGVGVYFFDSYADDICDEYEKVLPVDIKTLQTPDNLTLAKEDIAKLKKWVNQNQTNLLKLFDGISYWDIAENLKPIS